jgi:hypothetical protein
MSEARADAPASLASEERPAAPPRHDWTLRLFEASPVSPLWTGLALVMAYQLLASLFAWLSGSASTGGPELSWSWEVVNGVVIALPLTANAYACRGALRDLRELRPRVALDDAGYASERDAATRPPRAWLAATSGASVALMAGVVFFDPAIWTSGRRPGFAEPLLYWSLFKNLAAAYCFGRMLALEGSLTRSTARIASHVRIDLLAPETLAPLARKGQRSVLLWLLLSSCISLFWLEGRPASINLLALAVMLGVAAAAFLLPLARARERIAEARRAELRRVNALLEQERERLFAGAAAAPGRVADLVAWRSLVASVHEWPVTTPVLVRSALLVLLAVGSWLGGAVVERVVEAFVPR